MTHAEMKAVAEDLRLASYAVVEDEDGLGIGDYELLPTAATAIDTLLAELEAAKARVAVLEAELIVADILIGTAGTRPEQPRPTDPSLQKAQGSGLAGKSDGDILARMGTDGQAWAQTFLSYGFAPNQVDEGLLIGWFANAIEAGRSAALSSAPTREAVIEECAKVADNEAARLDAQFNQSCKARTGADAGLFDSAISEAQVIAAAIRARAALDRP